MSVCVILSIVVVIACDHLCDLGILSFSFSKPALTAISTQYQEHRNAASHGNDHNHHAHDHSPSAHNHGDESENEDCCNDLTQKFYSSLANQSASTIEFVQVRLFKALFVIFLENNSTRYLPFSVANPEPWHPPDGHLVINGQVIRVLIGSFLI
ncbi:MAG TPA: hypothetical protein PLG85_08590 [Cyclobacteriaceae bacterium]|nr:hypothetical protein [Cyclobacteriaceae bacterium]